MIKRELAAYLTYISRYFPVISVTGPRQSGKTTLIRSTFPNHEYCNLEDPVQREFALNDPQSFLKNGTVNMIIDEAQYAPQLFSYIQVIADNQKKNAMFILSGSQNFLLMDKITQSLAGRVSILHLLPTSVRELIASGWSISQGRSWEYFLYRGGYPGPLSTNLAPKDFYPSYIQSYIERDIRQLVNVSDLEKFRSFLTLCASRVGQQVNFSSLGNEIGIDSKTAARWLSVLETSFIVYRLPQFHKNFGKRLVKSPKLYFHDTGLVCYLLGLRKEEEIRTHHAKGSLFENFIITELRKNKLNAGEQPLYYYLRDNTGHEIDLISESGSNLIAVEIKSGSTIQPDFLKNIYWLEKITKGKDLLSHIIYGGPNEQIRTTTKINTWSELPDI
jgi:predicted AAA+ superfamily ATPase